MKRRTLLAGAALGAGAMTLGAPAIAQGKRVLKLVGTFPRGFPGLGTAPEKIAKLLTDATDGALTVEYFGGGELVPPYAVNDAVSSGAAEMGHSAPYFAAGKIPATMYFTNMPYGLSANELGGWIRYGGGQDLWDELYAPFNLKPFWAGSSMAQAGGWFRRPIESLDDLQGLKMRIAGLGGEIMQKVGVSSVNLPPSEIFPALQSGVVDAAEFVGPWNDVALGLAKVAPYYYMPAPHETGAGLETIFRMDVWEEFTPAQKVIAESVVSAVADETTTAFAYNNAVALEQLMADGVTPTVFPNDVVDALGKASIEVLEAYPAGDEMSEKVHGPYVEFIKQATQCGKVLEGQMYSDRARVWGI
ncbi:TRAP transporter substrate-binding protein [Tropicimonas sp. IMCC34011]|uniref:TRAP transporter substrate-binding protein n=1 Tax=Tropicimonas sp. IMCC34011 TaxID=2248759 RepID=UPI000E2424A2|nr:TRAP transporter substrate-binding protein [Tropicimonas sp. IMCC34011]